MTDVTDFQQSSHTSVKLLSIKLSHTPRALCTTFGVIYIYKMYRVDQFAGVGDLAPCRYAKSDHTQHTQTYQCAAGSFSLYFIAHTLAPTTQQTTAIQAERELVI